MLDLFIIRLQAYCVRYNMKTHDIKVTNDKNHHYASHVIVTTDWMMPFSTQNPPHLFVNKTTFYVQLLILKSSMLLTAEENRVASLTKSAKRGDEIVQKLELTARLVTFTPFPVLLPPMIPHYVPLILFPHYTSLDWTGIK